MTQPLPFLESAATFSPDRVYRYTLTRRWGNGKTALWIMLNPSTATEVVLDPTIRRCVSFSKAWGFGGLIVCNIFALRSTNPKALYSHPDPVGPENNVAIIDAAANAGFIVCAWGVHGKLQRRGERVSQMLRDRGHTLQCLGTTKDGHPKHPLYVRGSTELEPL